MSHGPQSYVGVCPISLGFGQTGTWSMGQNPNRMIFNVLCNNLFCAVLPHCFYAYSDAKTKPYALLALFWIQPHQSFKSLLVIHFVVFSDPSSMLCILCVRCTKLRWDLGKHSLVVSDALRRPVVSSGSHDSRRCHATPTADSERSYMSYYGHVQLSWLNSLGVRRQNMEHGRPI